MGETANKLVPVVLVLDWWNPDGVRHHAGETVKVPPATATNLLELGIALKDNG